MQIIKIEPNENGSHDNMTYYFRVDIPDGWALIPDDFGEMENFPFGEIKTKKIDGVMTVTKWIPGEIPQEKLEPHEARRRAYDTEKLIKWKGKTLTVTEAATQYMYYEAEGNAEVCGELQELIAAAKANIRERFPDEGQ